MTSVSGKATGKTESLVLDLKKIKKKQFKKIKRDISLTC